MAILHRQILQLEPDAWAQPGAQTVPSSDDVRRIRIVDTPLRFRAVAYDTDDEPTDDEATVDLVVVKIGADRRVAGTDVETLARCSTLAESVGGLRRVGDKQYTEHDVSPGEIVIIGIVSIVPGSAERMWIWIDSNAEPVD